MDFPCHTVCKYIISPSLLSIFLHIQGSVRHTRPLCPLSMSSLATTSLTGEHVVGTEPSLSEQTGGGLPQCAGTETRGAGGKDAASCSASSITPAHWETRWAACQRAPWPICLKLWQGTDKRDGDTPARQHLSESVSQTSDAERWSYIWLPLCLQWIR